MAYAFDTLGYAKRLRDAGISTLEAEAHAEAAREFVMAELVTRNDLEVARRELEASTAHQVGGLSGEVTGLRSEVTGLRADLTAFRGDVVTKQQFEAAMDNLSLRLTVRLGGMIAIAVAILATIIKL
jgi:hypothetical protein